MKRRSFLETGLGTTALAAGMTGCTEKEQQITPGVDSGDISMIGVKTLEELRDQYQYDIFDDFVVFFDRYIVDHEYGGFLCTTDHDGTNISTNKSATTLGRGIWCYSFLYNNLAKEDRFLDIASKAVEFTMKHRPSGDNFWKQGRRTGTSTSASRSCRAQTRTPAQSSWATRTCRRRSSARRSTARTRRSSRTST